MNRLTKFGMSLKISKKSTVAEKAPYLNYIFPICSCSHKRKLGRTVYGELD
jgi:hypothetical protein